MKLETEILIDRIELLRDSDPEVFFGLMLLVAAARFAVSGPLGSGGVIPPQVDPPREEDTQHD